MKKKSFPVSNRRGQAITEYILLLSIVLVSLGVFLKKITEAFDQMTASRGGVIERQIRTGSAPASLWTK